MCWTTLLTMKTALFVMTSLSVLLQEITSQKDESVPWHQAGAHYHQGLQQDKQSFLGSQEEDLWTLRPHKVPFLSRGVAWLRHGDGLHDVPDPPRAPSHVGTSHPRLDVHALDHSAEHLHLWQTSCFLVPELLWQRCEAGQAI